MTFAKGASLDDSLRFLNSSSEGNTRGAMYFREGNKIDKKAIEGAHSCHDTDYARATCARAVHS
jgi:hypothetical protein